MGIFRRVSDIISANLNDIVDQFEDPEKMLKQAIREMESCIEETTGATAKAIASGRLLDKELGEHEHQSNEWRERAEHAVAAGDDDLARQSLRRKLEHDRLVRALRDQSSASRESTRALRRQIDAMKAKHAEAKRKLAMWTARSKVAHARVNLQTARAGIRSRTAAFSKFDRMREKVELAEAEADALTELGAAAQDELQSEFLSRAEDSAIETELAALKQKAAP